MIRILIVAFAGQGGSIDDGATAPKRRANINSERMAAFGSLLARQVTQDALRESGNLPVALALTNEAARVSNQTSGKIDAHDRIWSGAT